jgi:hypothetical protein
MAHADYNCCAVCDCKMAYSCDATIKKDMCGPCVANLARLDIICGTVEELTKWVNETAAEKVAVALLAVGFSKCFYNADIDALVETKCPGVFPK